MWQFDSKGTITQKKSTKLIVVNFVNGNQTKSTTYEEFPNCPADDFAKFVASQLSILNNEPKPFSIVEGE